MTRPHSSDPDLSVEISPADGITFIGNATTIIRYGGFTLLTDPNFLRRGERARLGYGLSTRRLHNPAISAKDLRDLALDGVVLSHLHDDHWDGVAERQLDHRLPVLTTPAAARTLRKRGFGAAEGLRTWQHHDLVKGDRRVRITALPGRHGPGVLNRLLPPVMGSLLEFGPRGGRPDLRLYISGDTLMFEGVHQIAQRYPDIDAGIVHLGGTRPLGLVTVTMDGRQGAEWLQAVDCPVVVPVHFDDYTVMASPLSEFLDEVRARGLSERVRALDRGDTLPLADAPGRAVPAHGASLSPRPR